MAFAISKCGSTLVIQLTRDSSNSLHAEFKKEFVAMALFKTSTCFCEDPLTNILHFFVNVCLMAAARMRAATNEKAEGEKILRVKQAEGEAEARYLSGVGVARQRQAIVDGLQESVLAFANNVPGTSPKEVMDMVLVTQYFDTLKEIGSNSRNTAVFIPHGPGAVRDVAEQIRNGLLQGDVAGIAQHGS
jgi:hypothetical protein